MIIWISHICTLVVIVEASISLFKGSHDCLQYILLRESTSALTCIAVFVALPIPKLRKVLACKLLASWFTLYIAFALFFNWDSCLRLSLSFPPSSLFLASWPNQICSLPLFSLYWFSPMNFSSLREGIWISKPLTSSFRRK